MDIGMLWFDNDPKTDIAAKIQRAAAYYRQKYGQTPDICFIHPTMLPAGNGASALPRDKFPNVELRTSKSVRPHYFWIGIRETAES